MQRLRKYLLILFFFVLALLLSGFFLFQISKSRSFQFYGGLTRRINTDQKVVALTFDDAPSPYVGEVLGILKEKDVAATFYEIGGAIEQYPQEAKAIVEAGSEVGNHSYSHERFLLKNRSFIDSEIGKTNSLIKDSGYLGEITFRPPNGKKLIGLPRYLREHGIKTIMWDVEPDTYAAGIAEGEEKTKFLVDYTLENAKPGSIILLHPFCDSCASDRRAIGQIIDGLRAKGYRFATVSELLRYPKNTQ